MAESMDVPMINYLMNSSLSGMKDAKNRFPPNVLSNIQILVSVPEYVDVKGKEFPLSIRLRTKSLCEEECNKIQLTTTSADITQCEQFRCVLREALCHFDSQLLFSRCRPSPSYLAQYPIPPKEMQPPNLPLQDSHPMNYIFPEFFSASRSETSTRSFSLLPSAESGLFKLDENNYIFKDDRSEVVPTWYTINISLPFDNTGTTSLDTDGTFTWTNFVGLRASTCEPLFNVSHELAISLSIQYDLESGGVVKDNLKFKIPLTFANVAPRIQPPSARLVLDGGSVVPTDLSPSPSLLPAYSQLYDRNGERKIDYTVPLPLYAPNPCKDGQGNSDSFPADDEGSQSLVEEKCPLAVMLLPLDEEPPALAFQS